MMHPNEVVCVRRSQNGFLTLTGAHEDCRLEADLFEPDAAFSAGKLNALAEQVRRQRAALVSGQC